MNNEVTIFFDGGSRSRQLAGAGAVVYNQNGDEIDSTSFYIDGGGTNNQAEYIALREGLLLVAGKNYSTVFIKGDSLLVVKQVNGLWKCKNLELQKLRREVLAIIKDNSINFVLTHVRREFNKRADQLANHAMDNVPMI